MTAFTRRWASKITNRQSLTRSQGAGAAGSMSFVTIELLEGDRAIQHLVLVDDATRAVVAIVPAHNLSASRVVRVLERICSDCGYPNAIRADNAKEFHSEVMTSWALKRGVALHFAPARPVRLGAIVAQHARKPSDEEVVR